MPRPILICVLRSKTITWSFLFIKYNLILIFCLHRVYDFDQKVVVLMTTVAAMKRNKATNSVIESWVRRERSKRTGKKRAAMDTTWRPHLQSRDFIGGSTTYKEAPFELFLSIARRVVPKGIHYEIANALKENYQHRGVIYTKLINREPITRDHIYNVVVAHLRHEYTDYNQMTGSKIGKRVSERVWSETRKAYNNHDEAHAIMGEHIKW